MSMDYRDMDTMGCALKAVSQLEGNEIEMFEAIYGESVESFNADGFYYDGQDQFWNVIANVFEGNIRELDEVHNSEDYGRYMFNDIDKDTFDCYFDYEGYGKHLRETLSSDQLEEYDAENINDTELAQSVMSDLGGYDCLNEWDYDKFFNFKMFGEAKENDDVTIHDGHYYDVSDFDNSLGIALKENMVKNFENEMACNIFLDTISQNQDILTYWDVELNDDNQSYNFTCPTCTVNNYEFSVDVSDMSEVMIDLENQKLEFDVEAYAKKLQRMEDIDQEDSLLASRTIKTALDVLYNNAKDIAKNEFGYEYEDFDKSSKINKGIER